MRELPRHFIEKLEALLVKQQARGAPFCAAPQACETAASWLRTASAENRWCTARLQAVAAVLELLHAMHLEGDESTSEPMLGDHLLGGLLMAGRLLAGHAELQGEPRRTGRPT